MRQRKKLSWTKRGFVRTLGPKGFEKKFYLGYDIQLAEQKEKAIVIIWQQIEEWARAGKSDLKWDEGSLTVARAIEKGDTPKIPKRDHEWPEDYLQRVNRLAAATGLPVEPDNPEWYDSAVPEVRGEIARLERSIAIPGKPKLTGQKLYQAFKAYQAHIRKEYVEADGHLTDNGKSKIDLCKQLQDYIKDCDLGTLDFQGCDEIFGIFRKRPISKRYKERMARKSCTNLIGELGRFFDWLHLAKDWHWRKPEDFSLIKRSPIELDEDVEKEAADVPTYDREQLKILLGHALPMERVFILLALNCAYGADQIGRLRLSHLHLKDDGHSYIRRIRRKKKTRSIHLLWRVTKDALNWALEQRNGDPSPILLLNERGKPYWYKTKGGNRSQQIPNAWYRLLDRIKKDKAKFPRYGFNTLRDTSAQFVRDLAGEETASLHLAHKHQSRDENLGRYTNPARKRHFKALRKLELNLHEVLAVLGPDPWTRPAKNYIGLEKIKQIRAMHAQGTPIMVIARTLKVSQGTVYRHLDKECPVDVEPESHNGAGLDHQPESKDSSHVA